MPLVPPAGKTAVGEKEAIVSDDESAAAATAEAGDVPVPRAVPAVRGAVRVDGVRR